MHGSVSTSGRFREDGPTRRVRVFRALEIANDGDWISRTVDVFLIALISASVVAVILATGYSQQLKISSARYRERADEALEDERRALEAQDIGALNAIVESKTSCEKKPCWPDWPAKNPQTDAGPRFNTTEAPRQPRASSK